MVLNDMLGRNFNNFLFIWHYRDDWDLPDKTFSWASGAPEYPYFSLEKDNGLITMKHGVPEGRYVLHFKVYDRYGFIGCEKN